MKRMKGRAGEGAGGRRVTARSVRERGRVFGVGRKVGSSR